MPKIFSLFINSFSSLKLDYHPAIVQRRHAQRQLQAYEEAIADYNFVLELEPENLDAYYHRGLAYAAVGN